MLRRTGQHRNIIGFRGYFEREEKHYIVMEAATGGELFKQVEEKGVVAEEMCRVYFTQLLAGVQHLHVSKDDSLWQ